MTENDNYYQRLLVVDRILDFAKEKYGSLGSASVKMGYSPAYLQSIESSGRGVFLSTVLNVCKKLDVSVEYILIGKNKKSYKECTLNIERLIDEYRKIRCKNNNLAVLISNLKLKKRKTLSTKAFLDICDYTKKNPLYFIDLV